MALHHVTRRDIERVAFIYSFSLPIVKVSLSVSFRIEAFVLNLHFMTVADRYGERHL
jgi:hypothetical protein